MNALDFVLPAVIGIATVTALTIAEKRKKKAGFLGCECNGIIRIFTCFLKVVVHI